MQSSNIYVSPSFGTGAFTGTFSDQTLTDGDTVTFGTNAFSTIQQAIAAYQPGTTTAVIVNAGTYTNDTNTSFSEPANLVLQGGAVIVPSLDDSSFTAASIMIPSGTSLSVDGNGNSTNFDRLDPGRPAAPERSRAPAPSR